MTGDFDYMYLQPWNCFSMCIAIYGFPSKSYSVWLWPRSYPPSDLFFQKNCCQKNKEYHLFIQFPPPESIHQAACHVLGHLQYILKWYADFAAVTLPNILQKLHEYTFNALFVIMKGKGPKELKIKDGNIGYNAFMLNLSNLTHWEWIYIHLGGLKFWHVIALEDWDGNQRLRWCESEVFANNLKLPSLKLSPGHCRVKQMK